MTNIFKTKNILVKPFIFILVMVFTFTLTGCDNETELDYSDFSVNHLLSFEDVLTQTEDQYLVYYYGVNCNHCKTIKPDVLDFADYNEAELRVYFIDSGVVPWSDYQTYPINNPVTGEPIPGTPTMMVIKDNKIKAMVVGPSPIKDLLKQINEGTYGFID